MVLLEFECVCLAAGECLCVCLDAFLHSLRESEKALKMCVVEESSCVWSFPAQFKLKFEFSLTSCDSYDDVCKYEKTVAFPTDNQVFITKTSDHTIV